MELAKKDCGKSPKVVWMVKKAEDAAAHSLQTMGLAYGVIVASAYFSTEDHNEGINAFFEKRHLNFTGE